MMSATPIPRTLQLTLYGDLDVSTIDELPPGRQEIMTRIVPEDKRRAAYGFVRQQVAAGRQAFIICPLVEESEKLDARAAVDEHKRLAREVFPDLRLGLLHGRMPARDKDKAMRQFRDGALDILVATAVVEVGIDVPNATVMLIDGADRFGLSQLHQFRGRVGRGEHKSYCLAAVGIGFGTGAGKADGVADLPGRGSGWRRLTCRCGGRATFSAHRKAATRRCSALPTFLTRICWPWRGGKRC